MSALRHCTECHQPVHKGVAEHGVIGQVEGHRPIFCSTCDGLCYVSEGEPCPDCQPAPTLTGRTLP